MVARRSQTRAGSPQAVSRRACCAVALRRTAWSEHGMASVNQTRLHRVDQMGKTHSKPSVAWHGTEMAWARHAMCESAFTVSPVGCPAIPYFCTLSHKHYSFQKKVTKHKMCVLIFSTTFVLNISYSKKNSARYYHKCTNAFM